MRICSNVREPASRGEETVMFVVVENDRFHGPLCPRLGPKAPGTNLGRGVADTDEKRPGAPLLPPPTAPSWNSQCLRGCFAAVPTTWLQQDVFLPFSLSSQQVHYRLILGRTTALAWGWLYEGGPLTLHRPRIV